MPAFKQVFATLLDTQPLPRLTRIVFAGSGWFFDLQILIFALLWGCLLAYVAGPRLRSWLEARMPGLISGLLFKLPWRRKRMERDFSMVLALLLDAGVPEAEAVRRAGQSTDNTIMLARAERVVARLSSGIKLPDAIREMEDSDEAAWRLTNALRRGTGFMTALNGWHEALSARAFQLEQSAAQLFTTALVLFNGLIVGCVVIGLFEALIQILQGAVLW